MPENVDLKDTSFKPDIRDNPFEDPNGKPLVSQQSTKTTLPHCNQNTERKSTISQQFTPNLHKSS